MAATNPKIKVLVDRLCALPARQTEVFGIEPQTIRNELGSAIKRFATNDEHATKITDWLIFDRAPENRKWRPTPGEVREAADAITLAEPGKYKPIEFVKLSCPLCAGSGWKIVEKDAISGAVRCPCGSVPPRPGEALLFENTERKVSSGLTPAKEIIR